MRGGDLLSLCLSGSNVLVLRREGGGGDMLTRVEDLRGGLEIDIHRIGDGIQPRLLQRLVSVLVVLHVLLVDVHLDREQRIELLQLRLLLALAQDELLRLEIEEIGQVLDADLLSDVPERNHDPAEPVISFFL